MVLGDPDLGAFTVTRLIDQDERQLRREIDVFLSGRGVDDLVLVYLSCHGVLDRRGRLYFAAADTLKTQLASTGIPAAWLLDQLDDCRARRQVLILDCCFSGAFAHGSKGDADLDLERRLAGPGRGRAVLTASRAGEYSFEGQALSEAGVAGSVSLPAWSRACVPAPRTRRRRIRHLGGGLRLRLPLRPVRQRRTDAAAMALRRRRGDRARPHPRLGRHLCGGG